MTNYQAKILFIISVAILLALWFLPPPQRADFVVSEGVQVEIAKLPLYGE